MHSSKLSYYLVNKRIKYNTSFSVNLFFFIVSFFVTSYMSISSSQDQSLFLLFTRALLMLTPSGIYAPDEPDAILIVNQIPKRKSKLSLSKTTSKAWKFTFLETSVNRVKARPANMQPVIFSSNIIGGVEKWWRCSLTLGCLVSATEKGWLLSDQLLSLSATFFWFITKFNTYIQIKMLHWLNEKLQLILTGN